MQERAHRRPLSARILVITGGVTLSLIGLIGIFLPLLPGLLLLIPGLALLAGEFVWARRLLDGVRTSIVRSPRARDSDRRAA